jgi:hypothetical protein
MFLMMPQQADSAPPADEKPRESKKHLTSRHPKLESMVRPLLRDQWNEEKAVKQIEEIEEMVALDQTFKLQLGQVAAAVCETMLSRLGKGSSERIGHAIESFYRHWDQLEARRSKPGTHDGPYLIAPYNFYFGHHYAAQAIELLPDPRRAEERKRMFKWVMRTRNNDGLRNDPNFSRSRGYSTAMVLLALMSEDLGLPPKWEPASEKATPVTEASEAYEQRPEKYHSDPKKVMMKNVYVLFPDKTVRNVCPTPDEGGWLYSSRICKTPHRTRHNRTQRSDQFRFQVIRSDAVMMRVAQGEDTAENEEEVFIFVFGGQWELWTKIRK